PPVPSRAGRSSWWASPWRRHSTSTWKEKRRGPCSGSRRGSAVSEREHWEAVYQNKGPRGGSWDRPHPERSLRFIEAAGLPETAPILDVGGGASTLVDDLLDRGYRNVTVVDLSASAIAQAKARLGPRAADVTWIAGDITSIDLPGHAFDFWHDRAVFHF